jgi:hypothetical protein
MNGGVSEARKNKDTATIDKNLKRLADSNILWEFVKQHDGEWDCSAWHNLCQILEDEEYTPIDFDKVGFLLEEKRIEYFSGKLH